MAEAAWTLRVARALAERAAADGAEVYLTRQEDLLVPGAVRSAYAAAVRADVVLSLHLGPPAGHRVAAVRFRGRPGLGRRARGLAGCLFAALDRAVPVRAEPAGPRRPACRPPAAPWGTLVLQLLAHPPARRGEAAVMDAGRWAAALAAGLRRHMGAEEEPEEEPAVPAPPAPRGALLLPGVRQPLAGAPLLGPRPLDAPQALTLRGG